MNAGDEPYSEPLELHYHGPKGAELATTAFKLAAKLYDLQPEIRSNQDHCVGYFRLMDPIAQDSRKDMLFKQGTDLIRRLIGYKPSMISEPLNVKKVNLKDLREALQVVSNM